jgi:hypothetical protein
MMTYDLSRALENVESEARRDPGGMGVQLALGYLRARLPVNTPARMLLLLVADNIASYSAGTFSSPTGIDDFETVVGSINALRKTLADTPLPEVRRPRTPAELEEVARMIGVRSDWHEPDEQGVSAEVIQVTDGSFDNAGCATLERMVIIYQDLVPVAEVALATVFAWACQAGWSQPTRVEGAQQVVSR